MISFPEALDILEQVSELLKAVRQVEATVEGTVDELDSVLAVLGYAHNKDFQTIEDALKYLDKVVQPQMVGVRDSLKMGTDEHLNRLKQAREQMERLVLRMRMVVDDDAGDFFP
jgi:DNA integrity scanning protein DisA with diadenylate cyclase activity